MLPGYLPAEELAPAVGELGLCFPPAEGFHDCSDSRCHRFVGDEFAGFDNFPFASPELSLLAVNHRVVRLVETLLLVLINPLLVPVRAVGWWRLARDPELRTWRAFAVAYVLLAVLFMITGAKPYYLAGLYPVLLAAGAAPVLDWARFARSRAGWSGSRSR